MKLRSCRPRVAADGGDAVGDRIGANRQPADRRGVVGDDLEGGVGDEQDAVGATRRLLGIDEPVAVGARLQREVATLDRVLEHVVAQARRERRGRQRSGRTVGHSVTGRPYRCDSSAAAPTVSDVFDVEQLRIFTEPQQGATYDDLLAVARRAEQLGFGAFFRSDHYLAMGEALDDGGLPGPTDAWITLAGLARDTSTIRLGTLVTPATFRLPGVLAISVANVDQMSGGRVELGLGAGWYEQEHTAYGIPFPELGERFERLEEQLEIVTGLWSTPAGERFSFAGRHYQLTDSPALPKPVQGGELPIIIGGGGRRRHHAWRPDLPPSSTSASARWRISRRSVRAVIDACSAVGRDPASMTFSAALDVAIGTDEGEFRGEQQRLDGSPTNCARGDCRCRRRGDRRPWSMAGSRRRSPLSASTRPRRPRSSRCDRAAASRSLITTERIQSYVDAVPIRRLMMPGHGKAWTEEPDDR